MTTCVFNLIYLKHNGEYWIKRVASKKHSEVAIKDKNWNKWKFEEHRSYDWKMPM